MNFSVIIRSLGVLLMLLGVGMGGCLLLGELIGCDRIAAAKVDYTGWMISICATVSTGLLAYGFGKYRLRSRGEFKILRREAITVVGMGWIVCSLFAALPHSLGDQGVSYDKAFFEACSGFTTTGSSIYTSVEELPRTTLLWRSLTQWFGGMGILGAFLLIFSGETRGKTLFSFESSIHGADLSSTDLRSAMRQLWQVYTILTLVCMLGLWAMDMDLFQAVNHSLAATSTGGFGTENDSISSFSNEIKWWLIFFMAACGVSFPLYVFMWRKRSISLLRTHEETRTYFIIIIIASLILVLNHGCAGVQYSVVDDVFNVVSIITTTGFIVGDYDAWPLLGKQVIMLLMILGGCSGSTAGGLKISRIMLWIRALKNEVIRGYRPNVVLKLKMNGKAVSDEAIRSVYVVCSVAIFFFLFGSMAVSILEPQLSAMASASAVLTCICNVGPAFSELGPTQNFASLSAPTLSILAILMVLGRLEFIAVLVLFSRRLWRKY